jgi:DNA topoisomerase-1
MTSTTAEQTAPEIITDPVESAQAAGLSYVSDEKPGIRRIRKGEGFSYRDTDNQTITDEKTLERINALAIPPAWEDVWICPSPRGHIQATGRDARGRKQYRYHSRWRETRDQNKYTRMLAFGHALPKIRRKIDEDLALQGMPREKVLATVVRLLEETFIRVGNEEYARDNHSFGLTTLRNRHVDVSGTELRFRFTGKSGVRHDIGIHDRRIAPIIRKCQEMPGQDLFEYYDEAGEIHAVTSADVNDYLHTIAGEEFTAKDFRTWAGTVMAAVLLSQCEVCESESEGKKQIVETVKQVARQLGNTPAVCRKCYIHPAVFELYTSGRIAEALKNSNGLTDGEIAEELRHDERAVMRLLEEHLAASAN